MLNFTVKDLIRFFFIPKGRIKRLSFLLGLCSILLFSFFIMKMIIQRSDDLYNTLTFFPLLIFITYVLYILSIKRLHDINLSAWFCLIYMIPIVGTLFLFYLLFKNSVDINNKY